MEKRYLECSCESADCVVRFYWWAHEEDPEHQYLCLETQMNGRLPWYKRIWSAIKYTLFGGTHCGWSETIIFKKEVEKMQDIIKEYLAAN